MGKVRVVSVLLSLMIISTYLSAEGKKMAVFCISINQDDELETIDSVKAVLERMYAAKKYEIIAADLTFTKDHAKNINKMIAFINEKKDVAFELALVSVVKIERIRTEELPSKKMTAAVGKLIVKEVNLADKKIKDIFSLEAKGISFNLQIKDARADAFSRLMDQIVKKLEEEK